MSRSVLCGLALAGSISACVSCSSNSGSSTTAASAQGTSASAPSVEITKVLSKKLAIAVRLPGELQAYEVVAVFPKVTGFVDSISVDRGSVVKAGQLMARLVAPELAAQRAEAQSKLQGAEAQRVASEAKLASDESTYQRLKAPSPTPGVDAQNDLDAAHRPADGDRPRP